MEGSRAPLRSFVVEAYVPSGDQPAAAQIGARLRGAVAALQSRGHVITVEAAHLLPEDEVAFYVFSAVAREAVEIALAGAAVRFDRIAESIPITGRRSRRPPGRASPPHR